MPVTVTRDGLPGLKEAISKLLKSEVLVGIPDSTAERKPEPGEPNPASNAVIGYVMEFGDPEKNIPARPFLLPGIEASKAVITDRLLKTGQAALSGGADAVEKGLQSVGLVAQNAVRQEITNGSFVPLSERTIEARARRGRKGAKQYLKLKGQGVPTEVLNEVGLVKPLIDTGQLRSAITFVVRPK